MNTPFMRHSIIFSLLLILPFNTKAQSQSSGLFANDSLERYITQAMNDWSIPGAAVFIVKDGNVLLQKGYGVSNWNTRQVVDEKTVFPIASLSKTFTGTYSLHWNRKEKLL